MSNRRTYDSYVRPVQDWEFNYESTHVRDFFHHHPYLYCLQDRVDAQVFDLFEDMGKLLDWCKENCEGAYTTNIVNCLPDGDDWVKTPLGQDMMFIGFELEKDAFLFNLTWNEKDKRDV